MVLFLLALHDFVPGDLILIVVDRLGGNSSARNFRPAGDSVSGYLVPGDDVGKHNAGILDAIKGVGGDRIS
jgi:hypothetical protein